MTINLQSVFMSILNSEEKKSYLKVLTWLEFAEGYLNPVTKRF